MCDTETRQRLQRIEVKIGSVSTDVAWLKRLIGGLCILFATILGVDVSGMV